MILVLDTETSGKFNFKIPDDDPSQPRIIQLAAATYTSAGDLMASMVTLIKPDGWTIPEEASKIHGFTTADCDKYGIPLLAAFETLWHFSQTCQVVVAHNLPFDWAMLNREAIHYNKVHPVYGLKQACTMNQATPILKLPGRYGDFKWPTLAETHRHFFKCDFDGAHDAMADVVACAKCYFAMNPAPVDIPVAEPVTLDEDFPF